MDMLLHPQGPAFAAPRMVPMVGDSMEPTLRHGDVVLAVPVDGFRYDGIYVLSVVPEACDIYRVQSVGGRRVRLYKDNCSWSSEPDISAEQFSRMVLAQVAAIGRVIAPELLPGERV